MEGGRGAQNPYSFHKNLENDLNNNSWSPSTAIDKFLWSSTHHQENNSYCLPQQSFFSNTLPNNSPFFHPNTVFTGYSTASGGGSSDYMVHDWHEDDDILNSGSSSPAKSTLDKKSGSSTPHWIKGQWSVEEDRKLIELVEKYGMRKWAVIAEHMVGRIGKQCRERWQNHLRPDIKKDHWSEEEERLLIEAHERVGNKWAEIAKCIPGRTENSIKNHWNATKRKQVSKRKIKKPESANGTKQSALLEEYIKKKCFNMGGSTSTNSTSSAPTNSPSMSEHPVSSSDNDESITYLAYEAYVEEMDFMKNLFGNKEDSNTSSETKNYPTNIIIPSSMPTSTTDVEMPLSSVEGGSTSEPNMEQIGMPREIPPDAILYPEFYFCSYMLEGSFGSSDCGLAAVNQKNTTGAADAMEMDLLEMISSCNFS